MSMKINPAFTNNTPASGAGSLFSRGKDISGSQIPVDKVELSGNTPKEVGMDKETTQHIGNAGFGTASAISLGSTVSAAAGVGSKTGLIKLVPGLNFAVASIESYNAIKMMSKGEDVVAASHTGNAAGCMSGFLAETKLTANSVGLMGKLASKMAIGLGFLGGALGIAAGTVEISKGLEIKKAGGGNRTLTMGLLDMASGVTSATGTILIATGVGATLGIGLILASGVYDLSGIAVDYLGHKFLSK
ncbi:MAG: hypothetical protein LWY06_16870 [Firmicutes bacterium]|nr:hypothetical protein [Bacillota bacterium]